MDIIMLVQPEHLPIPESIKIIDIFGEESLMVKGESENNITKMVKISGKSMYLGGPQAAFTECLKPFDGIWISSNPALGDWEVVHVKPEL